MTTGPKHRLDPDAALDGDSAVETELDHGDLRYVEDDGGPVEQGDLPEEDDDNPFQDSDEALPDDDEERVLRRNPSKEGGLFDEA